MKVINKVCQILALLFGISAVVLFFTPFANVTSLTGEFSFVGSQLAFGGGEHDLAKSADILFCLLLTAFATIFGGVSFASKGARYATPAFGIVGAIYMLVIALSNPFLYVDTRPLVLVSDIAYTNSVLLTAIALFGLTVFGIAHLLIDDYLIVLASKGQKLTIVKRVVRFFKDYKSEVKKIVWPGPKSVIKNTVVVLAVCLAIGIVIWLVDLGLGNLLRLIWSK